MKTITSDRHKNRYPAGFTLLELLLALAITSIILVIIFGAFRVAIRAWEKSDQHIERRQRIRVVTQMIRRQLASALVFKPFLTSGQMPLFSGDESQFSFFSSIPIDPRNNNKLVFCQFSIESDTEGTSLLLVEKDIDEEMSASGMGLTDGDKPIVLAKGLRDIQFRYLEQPLHGEDWQWNSVWDAKGASKLPAAVKIELTDPLFSGPIVLIVPIRSGTSV